jgi:hypothetical protein
VILVDCAAEERASYAEAACTRLAMASAKAINAAPNVHNKWWKMVPRPVPPNRTTANFKLLEVFENTKELSPGARERTRTSTMLLAST